MRKAWRAAASSLGVVALLGLGKPVLAQDASVAAPMSATHSSWSVASVGADLAMQALSFIGVPYRFGGQDPQRGFDCSGLVRHVTQSVMGLTLPRTAEAMARVGENIGRDALQVGDLVFFNTRGRRYSHVGIYIGEGRFVHAPARRGRVRVEEVDGAYWQKRFNGARRIVVADAITDRGSEDEPVAAPTSPGGSAPVSPATPRTPQDDDPNRGA
jgi:hypothetical protein